MRRLIAGLCVVLVGLSAPAYAQRTTGTIIGAVTDESGAVLPGVTVTLTGAGVAGSPTSITSETGNYRFVSLPPGEYNLSFVLQGFATVNREKVVLPLAETVEIPIQMKVSTLQETVTVTGDSPVVDAATTEVSTNFKREWVENAPQRRFTFFDLINQAPGVSPATSTELAIAVRSARRPTRTRICSTAPTSPRRSPAPRGRGRTPTRSKRCRCSRSAPRPSTATCRAPCSTSSPARAATRSTATPTSTSRTRTSPAATPPTRRTTACRTTATSSRTRPVQLGGPIMKDKFWFFGSFQYQKDAESQPGTDPRSSRRGRRPSATSAS